MKMLSVHPLVRRLCRWAYRKANGVVVRDRLIDDCIEKSGMRFSGVEYFDIQAFRSVIEVDMHECRNSSFDILAMARDRLRRDLANAIVKSSAIETKSMQSCGKNQEVATIYVAVRRVQGGVSVVSHP